MSLLSAFEAEAETQKGFDIPAECPLDSLSKKTFESILCEREEGALRLEAREKGGRSEGAKLVTEAFGHSFLREKSGLTHFPPAWRKEDEAFYTAQRRDETQRRCATC